MTLAQRIYRKSRFIFSYLKSMIFGNLRKRNYEGIQSFILFVGYPRSGHTLVAALLDAHPEIVLGIEWGVLPHLRMGYRRNQILFSLERHSKLFTSRLNNTWTGYSYKIPDLWQGRYQSIKLIGDKMAGQTSMILKTDPELLDKLQREIACPVKIIHVIRNPYDTITTMARRSYEKSGGKEDMDTAFLSQFIDRYFDRVTEVQKLKEAGRFEIHDLYHEELIDHSDNVIERLLHFLGVNIPEHFVSKCSEAIYRQPHKSRFEFEWTEDLKSKVMENIGKYGFFQGYRYED
jgi:hypothetical protein